MKFALLLIASALIATGCSTVQPKAQVQDPEEVARIAQEKARDDLHSQMLGMLNPQMASASQRQQLAAYSAPAHN